MPPLTAGQLSSRLTLEVLSAGAWTSYATVWAQAKGVELLALLPFETVARQRRQYAIRKRSTAIPLPLRVTVSGRTMFAIAAVDDEVFRDQTELTCLDALDLTVGGSGSGGAAEAVTVYRGTDARNTDGSTTRTWASQATGVAMLIEDADETTLVRLFGHETEAHLRAIVPIDQDVRLEDGITVTSGAHTGKRYLVTARKIDPELPAQAYYSLGLSRTTEVFA